MRDGQIICWFDLDEDAEDFEEKRDSTISFYDEVVRFLVDRFGEEFKYEDPRISDDYIDRNNIHGQYEIVLDDDGENPATIAIWENEENEMKKKFAESENHINKLDLLKNTQVITNGRDAKINVDCPYCGKTRYLTSIPMSVWRLGCRRVEQGVPVAKAFPSLNPSDIEALETGKCRVCQMSHMKESRRLKSESRKLVKEGAGAGYTVEIKGLQFGKILSKKIVPDEYYGYYECQVEILPGEYEIAA